MNWKCVQMNPAVRHFVQRMGVAISALVVLQPTVILYFHRFHPQGPLAYLLAALPAVGIIGQIVAVALYLGEETDDFQRNLLIQAILWALGGLLTVTTVWGMLERFKLLPHFQAVNTFSLFWIFVGISTPFLLRKYR